MAKNVVAIVGRPNVGKSTFFNRCVGSRHAIVDGTPGVTRDRIYSETDWAGRQFVLVDTGGIITETHEPMANQVTDQVRMAIDEADVIVFMVDGKQGPTGSDEDVANLLRRSKKPVILAVNKVDTPHEEVNVPEFFSLGLGQPYGLSAMRGTGGVGDLLDLVVARFPDASTNKKKSDPDEDYGAAYSDADIDGDENDNNDTRPLSIAIVGKPNVGKSSIVNVLLGEDRTIVSAEPGTTRDAIDTVLKYHGRDITLIDTAGIRRKSRVDYGIEAFSVVRSLKAISRADVIILVLDANEEITDQDKKIANKIEEAGRAVVIVMNKWDLFDDRSSTKMNKMLEKISQELRHVSYAPVLFTSALNKTRVGKIIETALVSYAETRKRVSTNLVNQIINESVALTPPPAGKRAKRLKIYYSTQVSAAPPTFVLFVNDERLMQDNYTSYLERKLREAFGFSGTPIRITARPKKKGDRG
ncbi:MAG: ribosome biogenesis GTPase Der [Candidatus Obscuribacterales bacterium]|nr:ribosome biogenesis GTPase Der [Candidatus Obscuribacterales bacterium]